MKILINSDADKVVEIRKALKDNDGYCPCRVTKTKETRCICKEFAEQTEAGYCHCGLYYKEID